MNTQYTSVGPGGPRDAAGKAAVKKEAAAAAFEKMKAANPGVSYGTSDRASIMRGKTGKGRRRKSKRSKRKARKTQRR